eukprot:c24045_g1_i1 orf=98-685(+)
MAASQSCIRFHGHARVTRSPSSKPASFLSTKTGHAFPSFTTRLPCLGVRSEISGIGHSAHAQTIVTNTILAPGLEPRFEFFGKQSSDLLGTISSLYNEVGEEKQAAAEYVQRTAKEGGRSAEDYGRRALLFERSGEMAASSKLKGERVVEKLELLEGEVLERDEGRSAADYFRRAQIFSKSAEVFGNQLSDEVLP